MILITAPTSNIGCQLVDDLLSRDETLRVVARDPSRLASTVRERVEVVEGSHGDADVIERAAEGADAAFWLTPNIPDVETLAASFADFARPAAKAFAERGVARVVGISAIGRGSAHSEHAGCVTASLEMDDVFADSGVAYRAIVAPSFMDNLLNQADAIRDQGRFFLTVEPDLRAPTVATRDLAATAARLLTDASWSGTAEVPCLGASDISPAEQAEVISDVLGRPVSYVQIPTHAFKDRMTGFGMGEAMAQGLVDMFEAKNDGLDNAIRRTPESTTPTSFREWVEDVLRPEVEST